jgi:hypothetical protein
MVQVEHFLVYQQVFLDGGNKLIECIFMLYSSSICLSEAIDKANRLKADMKSIRNHDLSDASSSVCDEDLILHKALDVKKFSNFGDLAIFYLKHMSMLLQSAETIVDVFDRYDLKDSIKSAERERRSQAAGEHRIYHVNDLDTEQIYSL